MGTTPKELLHLFEEAFTRRLGIGFDYLDRNGRSSARRVEPHGLLVETPVWYILAYDVDKAEPRMFRMDRVTRPRILPQLQFRSRSEIVAAQVPDDPRWRPLIAR